LILLVLALAVVLAETPSKKLFKNILRIKMKKYPTISKEIRSEQVYVFDKLDGSNIRVEWSKKRGFYKFGTRKRLMDENDPQFGKAVELFTEKFSEPLEKVFRDQRQQKALAFFEFHGPNSFAGFHEDDDEHTVTLLDVSYQKGLLEPRDFLKAFGHLDIPALLHYGKVNSELIEAVRNGNLEGMTFEGVVAKGKYERPGLPLMFKIKNQAWLDKVKDRYQDRYEELA
jgi:hypothetical protein